MMSFGRQGGGDNFPTSPRLRGEVGFALARIRVRGTHRIRYLPAFVEAAPHPNPLPVKNGEREKWAPPRINPSSSRFSPA